MDGADRWTTFWHIVLPLARPALVVAPRCEREAPVRGPLQFGGPDLELGPSHFQAEGPDVVCLRSCLNKLN